MKSLKQYIKEYTENPKKVDLEIEQSENIEKPKNIKKSIPRPVFIMHRKSENPVKVYNKTDVPSSLNDKFLRMLGIEQYSKLRGNIIALYKSKRTKKRYGVIIAWKVL